MLNNTLKITELQSCCKVLFGTDAGNDFRFIEKLNPSDLKSVYRKRALDTHPDRFIQFGESRQKYCSNLFIEVKISYEKLNAYIKLRDKGFKFRKSIKRDHTASGNSNYSYKKRTKTRNRPTQKNKKPSYTPKGINIPVRPLRFGEFLYYLEIISWRNLIAAIVYQRNQRERIGEVACRWGWLEEQNLVAMLNSKRLGERLGDVLLRFRIITPFKLGMLLLHQQNRQTPIGEYFVQKGYITRVDLRNCLKYFHKHNHKVGGNRRIFM